MAAGCCSLYRTEAIRAVGGFRSLTMTEDMDMAWLLATEGLTTAYVAQAHCTAMEPTTLSMYLRQLDRWYRGMFQTIRLHRFRSVWRLKLLTYWYVTDALLTPLWLFLVLWWRTEAPVESFALALIADLGISGFVALCMKPTHVKDILRCLPAYVIVRQLNLYAYCRAFFRECIKGEHLSEWVKGHAA